VCVNSPSIGNVRRTAYVFAFLAFAAWLTGGNSQPLPDSAREIARQSMLHTQRNFRVTRDYTFVEQVFERKLDAEGREKSASSETYDIVFLYGVPYRRLIAKNGEPLSPAEAKKQEEKLAKAFAERKGESDSERKKRVAHYAKERERNWAFLKEIPDAFDFRLVGEETIQGRPAYVLEATPHPGYQPQNPDARFFPKIHGKMWVDKAELQWVKAEAETIGTISFGLFLARLSSGSHLELQQVRVSNDVWLPSRITWAGNARIALIKQLRAAGEVDYRDYKKFQSDSEMVALPPSDQSARPSTGSAEQALP